MRRMKWIALVLLLCGCASTVTLPPPQVSTADFAVETFPNDLYLISYKGPLKVTDERLFTLTLLKASQVAQQHQHRFFMIVDQLSSKTGEIKYRTTLPGPGEWTNELLIQGFNDRPHRAFVFRSEATEQAIYEKLRAAPEPETL